MRSKLNLLLIALTVVLWCGCRGTVTDKVATSGAVTQVATIDALLAGVYDGSMSLSELKRYGDFGIGTFDALDGEMLLLDGSFYQIRADGKVYRPELQEKTPFASVLFFQPEQRLTVLTPINYQELCRRIDAVAANRNLFLAIKVTGRFKSVKTRSVPRQSKPYPPLVEVTAKQPVFDLHDVSGTMVGFRLPPFVKGINVPGYHLHFISDDRSGGGHILDFVLENGTVELEENSRFYMILPERDPGFGRVDLGRDRSFELHRAEK